MQQKLDLAAKGKAADVQAYLKAGGDPEASLQSKMPASQICILSAPLLHSVIVSNVEGEVIESVRLLLVAGARVDSDGLVVLNERKSISTTPLMLACSHDAEIGLVKLLLQHGADPCQQSVQQRETALHRAADRSIQKCQLLLHASAGRAVHLACSQGFTPLHIAARSGRCDIMQLLYEHGASLHSTAVLCCTPLHSALLTCDVKTVQFLLRNGADLDAQEAKYGHTALHMAVAVDSVAVAALLLDAGASHTVTNTSGLCPVLSAAAEGSEEMMQLFCSRGLCASGLTDAEGTTLLMRLAERGFLHCVRVVLAAGADPNAIDKRGSTALFYALRGQSQQRRAEVLRALLEQGAAVDAEGYSGATPLQACCEAGDLECASILLAAGADAAHISTDGRTCLNVAKTVELLQALLLRGAVAVIDSLADAACDCCCGTATPLMCATAPAAVQLLLSTGADVAVTSDTGNTCLHAAAAHGLTAAVVGLLIKAGVDIHAVNAEGRTAAQVAAARGNRLIEALLLRTAGRG